MSYRIYYEYPAGSRGTEEAKPDLHGEKFDTLEEARNAIRAVVPPMDEPTFETNDGEEAWLESDDEGCGCFAIVPISVVFEVCTNDEWWEYWQDLSEVDEFFRDAAVHSMFNEVWRVLADAGHKCRTPGEGRSTFHGWNGANTFRRKFGPVGTFDELDDDDADAVMRLVYDAADRARAKWSKD